MGISQDDLGVVGRGKRCTDGRGTKVFWSLRPSRDGSVHAVEEICVTTCTCRPDWNVSIHRA